MFETSDYIICIIGKSGSGKSAIADYYRKKGFNVIDSYTDRPARYEGEGGHIFIRPEEVEQYKKDMIAYTYFDNHHYFATRSQYKNKGITFYVIDPVGVEELEKQIQDAKLLFIYINTDCEVRRQRMIKRKMRSKNNSEDQYTAAKAEAEKRMQFDEKAFELVKCNYVIDNNGQLQRAIELMDGILNETI